ncbi:MAG: ATP-binding protein [Gammaproteobacteria bacterium]|nr:ATP-binding protein [Gammaproteobacteria bacterium]
MPSNDKDIAVAYKPLAIKLNNFKSSSGPEDVEDDNDSGLFIGRKRIINKLVMLLEGAKKKRGSFLVAGYRGAGKTSVVNRAIYEHSRPKFKFAPWPKKILLKLYSIKWSALGSKFREIADQGRILIPFARPRKPIIVRLNLGNRDRLTPDHIFYSIANILRDELSSQVRDSVRRIGYLLLSLLMIFSAYSIIHYVTPIINHMFTGGSKIIWPVMFNAENIWNFSSGIFISVALLLFLIFRSNNLKKLDQLLLRMDCEITEVHNISGKTSYFNAGLSRKIKSRPLSCREIEHQISGLINNFKSSWVNNQYEVIFIFDEIDKLSEKDENSSFNREQKLIVDNLLGSLKSFITTTHATFFFIAGRETLDNYYSERGSANSLYESLFDHVIEVPSFLTGKRINSSDRPPMTRCIEQYLCVRLGYKNKEKNQPFKTLNEYYENLTNNGNYSNKDIRSTILVLRNFVNYLAFHSWGNPKRLSAIVESFVMPEAELSVKIREKISSDPNTENHNNAPVYFCFTFEEQRSFALTSTIFTIFQHQLSREVSRIGDKLTVTALSSLQFILKLHQHGFTRESLHRMSEAFNIYRAPELNVIVDDLLRQVFKPYIRRIRNGTYRYRFNSSFEQEIRYISYVSDLESASYHFSLDAMNPVKDHLKFAFLDDNEKKSPHTYMVKARTHVSLGDMNLIEQSFNLSSAHYSNAIGILSSQIQEVAKIKKYDEETVVLYLEAMLKYGDLEEYRQNYGNAAAIYSQANVFIKELIENKKSVHDPLLESGDSKWEVYRQTYWAELFLSLKRSPPTNIAIHEKSSLNKILFIEKGARYYYRYANLCFYLITCQSNDKISDEIDLAAENYAKTIYFSVKKFGDNITIPNERRDYLACSALVGLVETSLIKKATDQVKKPQYSKEDPVQNGMYGSIHRYDSMCSILKEGYFHVAQQQPICQLISSYTNNAESSPIELMKIAAENFKNNSLYISAVIVYFKIISYTIISLDFKNSKERIKIASADTFEDYFKDIEIFAKKAMECIDLDRQLCSSQGTKTLAVYDYNNAVDSPLLTGLFELLNQKEYSPDQEYPTNEEVFWQSSIWAKKLAAILYWVEYVRSKYDGDKHPSKFFPIPMLTNEGTNNKYIFEPSKMMTLSIRSSILMRWVFARSLINNVVSSKGTPICKDAYRASRNLYYLMLDINLISRKNLDLVFPTLHQVYYSQWKLLRHLIRQRIETLSAEKELSKALRSDKEYKEKYTPPPFCEPKSFREIAAYIQNKFMKMDDEFCGDERISASHFDYDFIYLKFQTHLQSSFNMLDQTSRTRTSILQQKYFAHDDHSDPEFRMDWTLEMMISPMAGIFQKDAIEKNKKMQQEFDDLLKKSGRSIANKESI